MAMEQLFQESIVQNNLNGKDGNSLEKWNSDSTPINESENNSSGGFECNICLDSLQDPVVTLCGHLFCWPCIYKWIHFQTTSTENKKTQCPVCKTEVSQRTIVPLYGRGENTKSSDKNTKNLGISVPRRPTPANNHTPPHRHTYPDHSLINLHHPTTDVVQPLVGMFGEMVYARIFGNSEDLYAYPNSYHLVGSNSPRLRRHLMQADRSLGRVCFFLFCCMVLCLVLF